MKARISWSTSAGVGPITVLPPASISILVRRSALILNRHKLFQARDSFIERTMESLRGAKRAIVHLYNATAPNFRRTVFGLGKDGVMDIAVSGARLIKGLAARQPKTTWYFQYSPETFTGTELEFAKDVCDAVVEVWNAPVGPGGWQR